MRVLLDECVPRKFKNRLIGHECRTVPEEGFAGKRNGELLRLAERAGFDVFLSVDRAASNFSRTYKPDISQSCCYVCDPAVSRI
jgi:hypothetical protein